MNRKRRNPVCRVCYHLVTAHDHRGCQKRRALPGGLVRPCRCAISSGDLRDPKNRIDPEPKP